jgi:uncharacterized protein (DUF1499 family)
MIPLLTLLGCAGERPATLGVHNGQLGNCPDSPNCVSSTDTRESHGIVPLSANLGEVKEAVIGMVGARVITENGDYLYAEFTTRLMGFVDDVEFLAEPAAGLVQVRSASRLGHSDMGVNRKRIEAIRAAVQAHRAL